MSRNRRNKKAKKNSHSTVNDKVQGVTVEVRLPDGKVRKVVVAHIPHYGKPMLGLIGEQFPQIMADYENAKAARRPQKAEIAA